MKRISTKSKRVHIFLSNENYQKLKELTLKLDKSMSLIISELIESIKPENKDVK